MPTGYPMHSSWPNSLSDPDIATDLGQKNRPSDDQRCAVNRQVEVYDTKVTAKRSSIERRMMRWAAERA